MCFSNEPLDGDDRGFLSFANLMPLAGHEETSSAVLEQKSPTRPHLESCGTVCVCFTAAAGEQHCTGYAINERTKINMKKIIESWLINANKYYSQSPGQCVF